MSGRQPETLSLTAWWIILCAYCNCAGWVLSAAHELNRKGYGACFLVGLAVAGYCVKRGKPFPLRRPSWSRIRRRFSHLFPLAFAILSAMAFLGGALHAPSNYDALAYRIPRVLHWLAAGQWHWIETDFQRVNTRACGIEWLSAPLIAFSRTERLLFLINFTSFLLLPGLVFSLFRRVGVKPRVAWHWMWLLPTGYCYILQAGSVSNDMFSTVFSMAAIVFALSAGATGKISGLCVSILAAALLTGAKTSNLPLLLPWVVALAPVWRLWRKNPFAVMATIPVAFACSFFSMAILNYVKCHDWTGVVAEHVMLANGPAWLYLFANLVYLTIGNLVPPVFPFASAWNRAVDAHMPASLAMLMQHKYYFEPSAAHWRLSELQLEEHAGFGFGLTILLGLSVVAAVQNRSRSAPARPVTLRLLCIAPWISLIYLMTKLNMYGEVRYLAAYQPLLFMGLLAAPAQARVVKRRWWRAWAVVSLCLAGLLLIISPDRTLWPAQAFFERYGDRLRGSRLGAQAIATYEVKANRTRAFDPVLQKLPPDASILGYYADDVPETALWEPLGSRRIVHVKFSDTPNEIRQRGLKYLLLTTEKLKEPWPDWVARMNVRDLQKFSLKLRGSTEPMEWHLVELEPEITSRRDSEHPSGSTGSK